MNDFLETKLISLKIDRNLSKNKTLANYKPFILSHNFVFISGQLPLTNQGIRYKGKIKKDTNLNLLQSAVELTTSNLLWNLCDCVKENDTIIKKIKCCSLKGYFNCEGGFSDHPKILNFSSDLIVKVLGEDGYHSRVAIGVSSLPLNSLVEIEAIFSIF